MNAGSRNRLYGAAAALALLLGLPVAPSLVAPAGAAGPAAATDPAGTLQPPGSFQRFRDKATRSEAIFLEMGKVLQHPRCLNCHPASDTPTQGLDMHAHQPPMVRGEDGHGPAGLPCNTCHQAANFEPSRVPGDPAWALAPRSMAWQGLTLGKICEQLKDSARNGGRDLEEIEEHMAEDHLVGWAWNPGGGRESVPGTQEEFGQLVDAWIESGAVCPQLRFQHQRPSRQG